MTSQEYQQRFNNVVDEFRSGALGDILIATAQDAMRMIKTRIQESGIDAKGAKFKSYTPSYEKYKKKVGKYRGFTDFSFTTRMWQNTQIVSNNSEANADEGKATISQLSQENTDKMKHNTERFGGILELSEGEINTLRESYKDRIYEVWERNGIGI